MDYNSQERRSYYRINDIVGLSYSVLGSDTDSQSAPESSSNLGMPLTNLIAEIDREFNQVTNTLWLENPTFAHAIGLLNKKISLIAAHSLNVEGNTMDSYEELMVNISGSGIAFTCKELLPEKTRLQLSVILKPSNIHLDFIGEVVHCSVLEANESTSGNDKEYWVSVNIDKNNVTVQEQFIQHVVQKQCMQLEEKSRLNEDA